MVTRLHDLPNGSSGAHFATGTGGEKLLINRDPNSEALLVPHRIIDQTYRGITVVHR
jgi:hypothetical protein